MDITPPATPADGPSSTAADSLLVLELDGELTIFDPLSARALFLNRTASAIWLLLDGQRDQLKLVAAVADGFNTEPGSIAGDVAHLLDRLDNLDLLEQRDPPRRRP